MDSVLLNKNVNLVFVCCQPNLHAQIATKALGIGKNVICLFPTCQDLAEIQHMIGSARYYPSLMSSVSYGGLKYLSEFRALKHSLSLIGEVKCCNVHISCQNLALARNHQINKSKSELAATTANSSLNSQHQRSSSISSLIDSINQAAASSQSATALNWLSDKELGAGCLNRFGATVISLILNLFENKKITKVFGSLRTFIEDLDYLDLDTENKKQQQQQSHFRKITADDFCTFQLNLEPESVLVNVSINSLAQTKYSQEVCLCGSKGVLTWTTTGKVQFRSTSKSRVTRVQEQQRVNALAAKYSSDSASLLDKNNNNMDMTTTTTTTSSFLSSSLFYETDISNQSGGEVAAGNENSKSADIFLNSYKNLEEKHPELPLLYVKGLFCYLENVKREFLERSKGGGESNSCNTRSSLENFEHSRIVQLIVKSIRSSSVENRWITVNYWYYFWFFDFGNK